MTTTVDDDGQGIHFADDDRARRHADLVAELAARMPDEVAAAQQRLASQQPPTSPPTATGSPRATGSLTLDEAGSAPHGHGGGSPDPGDQDAGDELHRSQLRMAERLADIYGDRLRYAHGLGWLEWDGARWRREQDGASMRAAIDVVKQALGVEADDDLTKDARKVETAFGLNGVLAIAKNLRPLAVAAGRLDSDPLLFNTANGTLDLRTGQSRPHDPADLITKVAGCGVGQGRGPRFEQFLVEILPDEALRRFVQRLFGYALLGQVREHVLPIFTGTGSNGKSTLVELLLRAFGDYAIAADPEMLVEQRFSQHPTGQADLLGVRLAVTQETDEGRRLAAATVKRLTGGDKIRARKMRQDFFEFEPSHTVLLVTNHRPRVAGDDPAMWRRLLVVPFDVVVPNPDPGLPLRLREELPAVLAWAVAGYAAYEAEGLAPPRAVTARTEEYRQESDALGRFLEERTYSGDRLQVRSGVLFTEWERWCRACGEQPGTDMAFAQAMGRRGYEKRKSHGYPTFFGLGLAATEADGDRRGRVGEGLQESPNTLARVRSRENHREEYPQSSPGDRCGSCDQPLSHPDSLRRGFCARCQPTLPEPDGQARDE